MPSRPRARSLLAFGGGLAFRFVGGSFPVTSIFFVGLLIFRFLFCFFPFVFIILYLYVVYGLEPSWLVGGFTARALVVRLGVCFPFLGHLSVRVVAGLLRLQRLPNNLAHPCPQAFAVGNPAHGGGSGTRSPQSWHRSKSRSSTVLYNSDSSSS